MAAQTFGGRVLDLGLRGVMRIVATCAIERTAAVRVTTAPGKRRPLKADPERIGARQGQFAVITMALAAKSKPAVGWCRLGLTIARSGI